MTTEIITADDEPAVRQQPVDIANWTPAFVQTIDQAVAQVRARDEFMHKVMRKDLDYGVIPGTGTKPTLLKPGAERLLAAYGLHAQVVDRVTPELDFMGDTHGGEPFFMYRKTCRIWRQTGPQELDRMLVGEASGTCNSWETKYRYRKAGRTCPDCGAEAIIKGKAEYGGGFVCFKKKDGCGARFADTDTRITSQTEGRVRNEDVADVVGTIEKMADKRALVAATIIATGWSDLVTQDVEDSHPDSPPIPEAAASPATAQAAPVRQPAERSAPGVFERGAAKHQADTGRARSKAPECLYCKELGWTSLTGLVPTLWLKDRGPNSGKLVCNGRTDEVNDHGERGYANHFAPLTAEETAAGDVNPDDIPF